ncbi:potassium channel family protein [Ruegeria lacuscaerulensis]|uniref:potassium channel family protein n=1 Tax=Ruegeria lacuscaerulensis TaxID=55218 RepID=UPI00147BB85E|nr:potassium channel family protein [Ruegeria lacuscaerulensis]
MGCDASYICTFLSVFFYDLIYLSPIIVFLLVLVSTLGISIGKIEGWSTGSSLYHAFINATTVGYGDIKPEKPASRALAVINAFVGLIFVGIIVGIGVHAVETAMTAEF